MGYGYYVVIRHTNGLETVYGHLSKQLVSPDQVVKAGEIIALGGNTGHSTGSHLHFETRFLGIAINPALMFDFPNQDVVADSYTFRRSGSKYDRPGSSAIASSKSDDAEKVIKYHKVHRGDTLSKVAKLRGVSISDLCQMNGLNKRSKLKPGQVLRCSQFIEDISKKRMLQYNLEHPLLIFSQLFVNFALYLQRNERYQTTIRTCNNSLS
eukprot:TRINITY_DN5800_c0_g1_i6.p2 TRINITY_DN5800_c0_g1~~TRINITY_DN5800_c0_g1_i6.p2  ORF type:complete len:210 (+),score=12.36 TRINITY_DN5800_c0_g1_i6:3-632(+)